MPKLKSPRSFWVLIDEKKHLIEYIEFPEGVKPKGAGPKGKRYRPRWAERQTGKRVGLYLPFSLEYTFIKTFNTKAGRGAQHHWDETSVEIWVVTVASMVDRKKLDSPSYDRKVDAVILEWIEVEVDFQLSQGLLSMSSRSTWKLQVEGSNAKITYPVGNVRMWRMPNYEEDLMKYATKKTVELP